MSVAANAMHAQARRAIALAPSNGNALSMLQDLVDDFLVGSVDLISASESVESSAVSSSVGSASEHLSAHLCVPPWLICRTVIF